MLGGVRSSRENIYAPTMYLKMNKRLITKSISGSKSFYTCNYPSFQYDYIKKSMDVNIKKKMLQVLQKGSSKERKELQASQIIQNTECVLTYRKGGNNLGMHYQLTLPL